MRQNLRKILAVLVMAVTVLGLAACGSSASEDSALDMAYCQNAVQLLLSDWNSMSAEEIGQIAEMDKDDLQSQIDAITSMGYTFPFTADALSSAFAGYESSMEDLGAYVSTTEYELPVLKSDGDTSFAAHLQYEERTATLTLIFNEKGIVESVAVDPEYTPLEIAKKAFMNTILGMGTVFMVLIFLSLLIYCFNFIPKIQAKFSRKKETPAPEAAPKAAPAPAPAPVPAAEEEELIDDGELVAAITAAICAYRGNSGDGFVVRSIRRADSAKWKRS